MSTLFIATLVWLFWAFIALGVAVACRATYLCFKEGRQVLRERRLRAEADRRFREWRTEDEQIAYLESVFALPSRGGYMQGGR